MTFPMMQELLSDPNVWIGDTGATIHMTSHVGGLSNICDAKQSDLVTMGNMKVEKASKIGDLAGMVCDNTGNELGKTMVKDVAYIPTCGYNLFSITKLLKEGTWTLIGSKNNLTLKKNDGREIVFDICIPTPKGMIFAMYIKRSTEVAGVMTDVRKPINLSLIHISEPTRPY